MDVVHEARVERCTGSGFIVRRGQTFRVVMAAGKQVGDLTVVNLNDHRDGFSDKATTQLSGRSFSKATELYSGPPHFTHLMTVTDDRLGVHFIHGRCSTKWYELFYGRAGVRGCHENLVSGFAEVGVAEKDVPYSTFNVFMKATMRPDGSYFFDPPVAEVGDYVDFRAEVDVAVGLSACPHPDEVNDYQPQPLDVQILATTP